MHIIKFDKKWLKYPPNIIVDLPYHVYFQTNNRFATMWRMFEAFKCHLTFKILIYSNQCIMYAFLNRRSRKHRHYAHFNHGCMMVPLLFDDTEVTSGILYTPCLDQSAGGEQWPPPTSLPMRGRHHYPAVTQRQMIKNSRFELAVGT